MENQTKPKEISIDLNNDKDIEEGNCKYCRKINYCRRPCPRHKKFMERKFRTELAEKLIELMEKKNGKTTDRKDNTVA